MTTDFAPIDSPWFVVVVAILAASRITRLITADSITEQVRLWASRYDWSRTLVHCAWCSGFWVSLAVVVVTAGLWFDPWVVWPMTVLAMAELVGIIHTATERMSEPVTVELELSEELAIISDDRD